MFFSLNRRKRSIWLISGVSFLIALIAGCKTPQSTIVPADGQRDLGPPVRVILGQGDVVDVKFFSVPELNESQAVRPDGKITLQLIGDVVVEGKAPEEVRDELIKLYTPELRKPEITVIVRSLHNRRVYVGGEVKSPGLIPMPGRLTALEAIMQAGGFNMQTADLKEIVVIRLRDGHYRGDFIDIQEVLEGNRGAPFFLEPHDIIYVPRSMIADLNQFVDQYINKLVPQFGYFISYPLGKGAIGINTSTK